MIMMEEIIIIANNDNRKKEYIDYNVGILYNNSIELSIKFENDFQQELLVKKSFSESNFSINNIELAMHMINSIANNVTYNRVLSMNSLILTINS